jgi:glycosyltransferase involved in cell wall biosynthesis
VDKLIASIAICTYNRANSLEDSIRAASEQRVEFDYEVIVVDNKSTDGTKSVVRRMQEIYPHIRYVREENQGIAYARNCAVHEARGDIVAFTDDDGIAQPGWLAALVEVFDRPEVGGVAGKIVLDLPDEIPTWLNPAMYSFLAAYDRGPEPKETDEAYTCNFAFRRAIAIELGAFSVKLGFCADKLLPGEDTDFARRLILAGNKLMYMPHAVVFHRPDASRLNEDWFLRRYRQQGRVEVLIGSAPGELSDIMKAARELTDAKIAARVHDKRGESDARFHNLLTVEHRSGLLDEFLPRLPLRQRYGIMIKCRVDYCKAVFRMARRINRG